MVQFTAAEEREHRCESVFVPRSQSFWRALCPAGLYVYVMALTSALDVTSQTIP